MAMKNVSAVYEFRREKLTIKMSDVYISKEDNVAIKNFQRRMNSEEDKGRKYMNRQSCIKNDEVHELVRGI